MKTLPQRPWKAIAAMARNRVIGQAGGIPWNVPGDLRWVRQCTLGKAIAMGRKTFESLGKPLPGRENIVLSRKMNPVEGITLLSDLEALKGHQTDREIWIFGGAEIYRQALPFVDDLWLTTVDMEPEGDTFFPPFEEQFVHAEAVRTGQGFRIDRFRNRAYPE
ncbi:MAG: dihydrofolate reductase [Opitutales bacterium]|nr:dihydrofolate reductase [Opitutales bacterium]